MTPPSTPTPAAISIGIVTVSDRASQGVYEDLSGQAIQSYLGEVISSAFTPLYRLIPDEQPLIESTLIDLADTHRCALILTTGGTGPSPRDVTPEATHNVCHKLLPGFGELMRSTSLHFVPTAILSRQTAGIRHQSLIINLPGKPQSIYTCLDAIFPAIPYCIDLALGPFIECNASRFKVFRPKS
jgi:molybdopterin adenylyltransferase